MVTRFFICSTLVTGDIILSTKQCILHMHTGQHYLLYTILLIILSKCLKLESKNNNSPLNFNLTGVFKIITYTVLIFSLDTADPSPRMGLTTSDFSDAGM